MLHACQLPLRPIERHRVSIHMEIYRLAAIHDVILYMVDQQPVQ